MKKRTLIFRTICLLLIMLLTLTACSTTSQQTSETATTSESGPRTDLKYLISYEPTAISPGGGTRGVDMTLCTNFYDTLIFENGADRTSFKPGIASEWKFNDVGDELVLKIRDDVTFHDGAKLTCDDVIFSLQYDLAQPPNSAAAATIKDYKITGDNEITIYLNYPYKPILGILATPNMSIINKAFYEKCQKEGTNFQRVENGTGPYILDKWEAGVRLVLKANDNWFGGDVAIKDVVFQVAQDSTTAAMMMENGQADAYFSPAASDVKRLDDLESVDNEWAISYSTYMIFFNTREKPFNDPKLREAIAYGIDREAVLQGGQAGIGMVQPFPVAPGFFGYQEGFEVPEYNLELAKQKLAEAGYPEGSLKVTMRTSSDTWYSLPAQVVQSQFQAMGIDCELEIMENGAFQSEVLTNHNFQVGYYNSYAFVNDADAVLWQYYQSKGDRNFAGVQNKEIDDLLLKARLSMDDKERLDCYMKIAEINRENNYYIYTLTGYNSMVHSAALKGVFGNNAGIYKLSYWSW
jgi:peptide/nickel transport system substrate-binding protein